jgi:hypothetical protein
VLANGAVSRRAAESAALRFLFVRDLNDRLAGRAVMAGEC